MYVSIWATLAQAKTLEIENDNIEFDGIQCNLRSSIEKHRNGALDVFFLKLLVRDLLV